MFFVISAYLRKKIFAEEVIWQLFYGSYAAIFLIFTHPNQPLSMNAYKKIQIMHFNYWQTILLISAVLIYFIFITVLFAYHRYQDYQYNIRSILRLNTIEAFAYYICLFYIFYYYLITRETLMFISILILYILYNQKQRFNGIHLIRDFQNGEINLVMYTRSAENLISPTYSPIYTEVVYQMHNNLELSSDVFELLKNKMPKEYQDLLITTVDTISSHSIILYVLKNDEDGSITYHINHILYADIDVDYIILGYIQEMLNADYKLSDDITTSECIYGELEEIHDWIRDARLLYDAAYIPDFERQEFLDSINSDEEDEEDEEEVD